MNQASAVQRGRAKALQFHAKLLGSIISGRDVPQNYPSEDTIDSTAFASVNGRKVTGQQMASVEYLSDDRKLQIQRGLIIAPIAGSEEHRTLTRARRLFDTVARACGVPANESAEANLHLTGSVVHGEPNADALAWAADAMYVHPFVGDTLRGVITIQVGNLDENGAFIDRSANLEACEAYLVVRWDADEDHVVYFASTVNEDIASPVTTADVFALGGIRDQVSDWASGVSFLNYSVVDYLHLRDDDARWPDDKSYMNLDVIDFVPDLTAYSLSCLAAINLPYVKNIPILAWTRAYGVAMGLVPSDDSLHNSEYQTTEFMPSDEELSTVCNAHGEGQQGQITVRAAWSIIAAFGACHLANDHTFKASDKELLRRARAMIYACRTVLSEDQLKTLMEADNLEASIRTVSHCFGLASTWGAFRCGQRFRTIAEPLQIRKSIVPPTLAKVGLVVSTMEKMLTLPIGELLRTTYGKQLKSLTELKASVLPHATAFSSLYKHYGHAAIRVLTDEEDAQADTLMPLVSGYADVFERDREGKPIGALLARSVASCIQSSGGLVTMYANAFLKYSEKSAKLVDLITGKDSDATKTSGEKQ